MKKLMLAAAIVCAAVTANAIQVVWGGAAASDPAQSDTLPRGTMCYLVYNATSPIIQPETFDGKTGVVSIHEYTQADSDGWTFSETFDGAANGYYAVLIRQGDYYSFYNAGLVQGTDIVDIRLNYDWSGAEALTDGGFVVSSGGGGGGVPEPTSAMLMLLGVAGLALKRKQK